MGVHRTRQSNRAELCPICEKRLSNRAAAASHYRTHVKEGELVESSYFGYAIWNLGGVWFRRGIDEDQQTPIERRRDAWVKEVNRKQKLYRDLRLASS